MAMSTPNRGARVACSRLSTILRTTGMPDQESFAMERLVGGMLNDPILMERVSRHSTSLRREMNGNLPIASATSTSAPAAATATTTSSSSSGAIAASASAAASSASVVSMSRPGSTDDFVQLHLFHGTAATDSDDEGIDQIGSWCDEPSGSHAAGHTQSFSMAELTGFTAGSAVPSASPHPTRDYASEYLDQSMGGGSTASGGAAYPAALPPHLPGPVVLLDTAEPLNFGEVEESVFASDVRTVVTRLQAGFERVWTFLKSTMKGLWDALVGRGGGGGGGGAPGDDDRHAAAFAMLSVLLLVGVTAAKGLQAPTARAFLRHVISYVTQLARSIVV